MTEHEHPHEDPGLSALYRRTPRHEPSAASDDLIRTAARSAVSKTRRQRQFIAPLAVAATLVLSVGIGWQVFQTPDPKDIGVPDIQMSAPKTADEVPDEMPEREQAQDRATTASPAPRPMPAEAAKSAPAQAAPQGGQVLSEGYSARSKQSLSFESAQQSLSRSPLPNADMLQRSLATGLKGSAAIADCDGPMPDEDATQAQWEAAFAAARRDNDGALLRCLHQHYERRFGMPYPADAE